MSYLGFTIINSYFELVALSQSKNITFAILRYVMEMLIQDTKFVGANFNYSFQSQNILFHSLRLTFQAFSSFENSYHLIFLPIRISSQLFPLVWSQFSTIVKARKGNNQAKPRLFARFNWFSQSYKQDNVDASVISKLS